MCRLCVGAVGVVGVCAGWRAEAVRGECRGCGVLRVSVGSLGETVTRVYRVPSMYTGRA